ncbi:hypothetical protein OGAPHI_001530 [Ogataea philodendri]|uniref:Uncharacterized protein n=1 Tax=Ogataea philodendri TaxID=1378263 RepID=A0A9P8T8D4_9ASCO|nr:uncharacterized protein OGAPHI_001530 [Ogataea philodendri]KAH3669409.1 hypothetical protein OGAPHI_001530 [Ogataea philodendri]
MSITSFSCSSLAPMNEIPAKTSAKVHFGGDLHVLCVLGHGVRGEHQGQRRHWVASVVAREPDPQHSTGPEYDAHAGMLVVAVGPWFPWPVFCECVDDSPRGDHDGVVKLLRVFLTVAVSQPRNDQHHAQDEPVPYEGGAHDPVRVTLSRVQTVAESQR